MLEDFRLKVFMAVAGQGSFTRAAAELGVTQPAVSQNIADLERMTGTKLFDRLRGEVVLTPQGHVFLEYAGRILQDCASAGTMFSTLSPSTVRICASEEIYTYLIAPAMERFITVHPEIVFERVMFGDPDLLIELRPAPASPFEINPDSIARVKVSMSQATKMGDTNATHEKSKYFDLLFKPSQAFACTKTCRLLKDYLASLL